MRILKIIALIAVLGAGALAVWYWQASKEVPAEIAEETYAEPVDRFVEVAGARIRIREEGPADAPVLLMLHGFTYSLETWDAWAEILSDRYRVVRYDLLGHGLTGPDLQERYAPEERAAFVGEVMDALGIDQAMIAGNSLGGLAAWRFAGMAPERVEALILISPGAYPINGVGDDPAEVPGAVVFFLQTAPEAGIRATLPMLYADPDSVSDERVTEIGEMMRREGNGAAMVRSLEKFTLPDPDSDLARVTAPTLILWGEADQLIPPAHGERLVEALPDARLITYPDVGHVAQEEAPGPTSEDAAAFLAAVMAEE
ncbi:MAG: alpha/beta fold hydrolase [Pseudomonadota bacterium]